MATAPETIHTPEDLQRITDLPTPELIEGQRVEREPMGQEADAVAIVIGSLLLGFSMTTFPGILNGPEGGNKFFRDDPNRVRFSNISFMR